MPRYSICAEQLVRLVQHFRSPGMDVAATAAMQ